MTPPSSSVASLSFFCLLVLLLPAQHGASSHYSSYRLGSRQFFFKTHGKSSGNSHKASTCSSLATGRFSSQSSLVAESAPSPATIIPANGWKLPPRPGALDYIVLVSFGMPEQQFPMFLRTSKSSTSLLRCKPCTSGSDECDLAFDPSRSSTFAHILCGSPDCPVNCSDGSFCAPRTYGTFAEDVLTLAPSMAIHDFPFLCQDHTLEHHPVAGTLDLGRGRNSLPSRLRSSSISPAANFSYCLPRSSRSQGFLSLGGDTTFGNDNKNIVYAPLMMNGDPELASFYFIDLVGISLGDEDLPIPAETLGNNGAKLGVGAIFTSLTLDMYILLRDSFRKQMLQYNNLSSPRFVYGFDTCFNFTGLNDLVIPLVQLKFSNGDSLVMDGYQMLYYDDLDGSPFTMACLAFSHFHTIYGFSVEIGTHSLSSTEVVYDVAGGKIGFIPESC